MKKSRTTMKVPARTTGRAAQPLDRARASRVVGTGGDAMSYALMMRSTVAAERRRAITRGGMRLAPNAGGEPLERRVGEQVAHRDERGADDRDAHEHREVA